MCCKTEDGRDKVIIPLGVGHSLADTEQVEFAVYQDSPLAPEEAARRFHAWMRATVGGTFYDYLRRELQEASA